MEIDEQPDSHVQETQIREQLGFEDGIQFANSFQFDDDFVVDQEIEAIAAIDASSLVFQRDIDLSRVRNFAKFQFAGQAFFVG